MKIDRQIAILSMLLQREAFTAPYLAEKFEVSRRTINRDIEDLCKAGILIVTKQGVNGGIGWKAFISSRLHRSGEPDYLAVVFSGQGRIVGTGRNKRGNKTKYRTHAKEA